jgi:hypothetical protein
MSYVHTRLDSPGFVQQIMSNAYMKVAAEKRAIWKTIIETLCLGKYSVWIIVIIIARFSSAPVLFMDTLSNSRSSSTVRRVSN